MPTPQEEDLGARQQHLHTSFYRKKYRNSFAGKLVFREFFVFICKAYLGLIKIFYVFHLQRLLGPKSHLLLAIWIVFLALTIIFSRHYRLLRLDWFHSKISSVNFFLVHAVWASAGVGEAKSPPFFFSIRNWKKNVTIRILPKFCLFYFCRLKIHNCFAWNYFFFFLVLNWSTDLIYSNFWNTELSNVCLSLVFF